MTDEKKTNTFVIEDLYLEMVLKGHKFVKSIDELETIQLNWSEKEHVQDGFTLARALVDGLWAWQRASDYAAKVKGKVAIADELEAARARKERLTAQFNKLIAAQPNLAVDEAKREEYLNLQRQYDVIDHTTYLLLMESHRNMQKMINKAIEEAKLKFSEENKQKKAA